MCASLSTPASSRIQARRSRTAGSSSGVRRRLATTGIPSTSSAATVNPATGKLWGPDFPKFTVADTVETQRALIDHLGIGQLKAVIGYSYGGHLTYRWGATYPERMRALVPIAGVIKRETTQAQVEEIRGRYAKCAGWNGGHYVGNPDAGAVYAELAAARVERLTNYGIGDYLADTLGGKDAAAIEIKKRGDSKFE